MIPMPPYMLACRVQTRTQVCSCLSNQKECLMNEQIKYDGKQQEPYTSQQAGKHEPIT